MKVGERRLGRKKEKKDARASSAPPLNMHTQINAYLKVNKNLNMKNKRICPEEEEEKQ